MRAKCPMSGGPSTRFPGVDECEHCGRMVRTREDGTYAKHELPIAMRDPMKAETVTERFPETGYQGLTA